MPLVHDVDWKDRPRTDNLCKDVDLSFGDVPGAFASADATVENDWFYEGSTHAPIEPHCAVASWSPDGHLTLWSASQVTHYLHRELAKVLSPESCAYPGDSTCIGRGFWWKIRAL